jgi:hypothetical protein
MHAPLATLTFGVTLGLTALSVVGLVFSLGPGFLVYLAALGSTAFWLLPGVLAQTVPVGLLGGALLAGVRGGDQRPTVSDAVPVAILGMLLSAYCVGWGVPEAYVETGAAADRATGQRATLTPPQRVRRLELPALLRDTAPEARPELQSRTRLFLRAVAGGLVAIGLVASRLRWGRGLAWGVIAVAFVLTVRSWAGDLPPA